MQLPTPTVINEVAKASQYLAGNDIAKGALFGRKIMPNLDKIIYLERKALDWMLGQDSSYSTIQQVANYVKWLCGMYYLQANAIVNAGGSGQSVTPVTPTPLVGSTLNWIELRKADFANTTDYVDSRLRGKQLSVIGSWLGSRLIDEGLEWEFINDDTFRILIEGFDSSAFDDDTIIVRIDINGAISAGATQVNYTYDLSADAYEIPSLPTGTPYQSRNVIVRPNGYTYTWAGSYAFSDNWPEQPSATDADTKQVYQFMYIAGVGDVCVGQSLNIAL